MVLEKADSVEGRVMAEEPARALLFLHEGDGGRGDGASTPIITTTIVIVVVLIVEEEGRGGLFTAPGPHEGGGGTCCWSFGGDD